MPLYARMWQENFPETVEKAGFYSLKDGRVSWFPKKVRMEEFIQGALQSAEKLVKGMKRGLFPPEPFMAGECRYCYHSPLCQKEISR